LKITTPVLERSLSALKLRRELLDARTELETISRKLLRTENALDSLSGFLTLIPDPIEIVAEDLLVLFANESSKKLHHNPRIEGTLYYQSVLGTECPPDDHPIHTALRENRGISFSTVYGRGDVYETAVTPTTLSDGRRAAFCISKPVVLSGTALPDEEGVETDGVVDTAESAPDETTLLRRIARLSTRTLDAVLDQISDGVAVTNERGDLVLASRAFYRITGRAPGGVRSLFELSPVFQTEVDDIDGLAAGSGSRCFQTTFPDSDSRPVPVEVNLAGIPADADNPSGILVTIRKLDDQHDAAEAAQSES
jgi:hypothetical protein